MSDAVIRAEHLTRRFGAFVAVRDVSFEIPRASIFGLLGPNGSGKSTIIRMLCGVLRPSEGSGFVLGVDVSKDPEAVKRSIGYMSQRFSLYGDLSCIENLRFYGRVYGLSPAKLREREEAVMSLTGIGGFQERLAAKLSGGWKQRLALACALIHEPAVLFLDEPTAGIDPVARRDLWDLLFELAGRGVTMFVTTHYMDEAERCSSVGYIHSSRLIAAGAPDELKRRPEVTPYGTCRFELQCGGLTQAMARARVHAMVRDVTMFGDRLHLLVDERFLPGRIAEELAKGDRAAEVRSMGPTLEDVFVILSRTQNEKAA